MPLTVALYLADQNPSRDRSLGITRATLAIAEAICRDVRLIEIVSQSSVRLPPGQAAQTVVLPLRTDGTLGRALADLAHPALARPRADVWFYPKGFVTSPVPPGAPALALVHDTILDHYARHHPDDRPRWQMALWLRRLRTTLRRATRVATVSETARTDILAFCARHGIPDGIDDTAGQIEAARHYELDLVLRRRQTQDLGAATKGAERHDPFRNVREADESLLVRDPASSLKQGSVVMHRAIWPFGA